MKVVVDTSKESGLLYEVSEYDGRYYVYPYGGIFITQQDCIGKANSLKSALAIIKSHAPGRVHRVHVQDDDDDSDEDASEDSGESDSGSSIHLLSLLVILLVILMAFSNMQ